MKGKLKFLTMNSNNEKKQYLEKLEVIITKEKKQSGILYEVRLDEKDKEIISLLADVTLPHGLDAKLEITYNRTQTPDIDIVHFMRLEGDNLNTLIYHYTSKEVIHFLGSGRIELPHKSRINKMINKVRSYLKLKDNSGYQLTVQDIEKLLPRPLINNLLNFFSEQGLEHAPIEENESEPNVLLKRPTTNPSQEHQVKPTILND